MRAFRHSKLLKACTAANKFALLTSAYIWPGGHIYCSRLEGIKSKLLNTLARLSSKDIFNLRRLSLHPLKGVYTPFSRGPFGTL